MKDSASEMSQRTAARLAGFVHVFVMPFALFPAFYVWPRINVPNDAAGTAANLITFERLYRIGIVSELITWALDIVLLLALYVLLRQVHKHHALLAAFFRIVETSILLVTTLLGLVALQILHGDYMKAFEPGQQAALARLAVSASAVGYDIGLMFLGLGSATFAYLFFKSGYIPRALAGWGVFASVFLLVGVMAMVIFPDLKAFLMPGYFVPIFSYELALGLWLLLKDVRLEATRET